MHHSHPLPLLHLTYRGSNQIETSISFVSQPCHFKAFGAKGYGVGSGLVGVYEHESLSPPSTPTKIQTSSSNSARNVVGSPSPSKDCCKKCGEIVYFAESVSLNLNYPFRPAANDHFLISFLGFMCRVKVSSVIAGVA
jgi:hypothetical protein